MEGNGTLTILEASKVTGKSITTIHRYVKKGLLHVKTCYSSGKQVLTVEKEELKRVFNIHDITCYNMPKHDVKTCYNNELQVETNIITKEALKETFKELFEEQKLQLFKPIEDQSLYRLGRIEQENLFLKQRLETVLCDYKELQEKIKALPDPQIEIEKENLITVLKDQLTELHKEKETFKLQAEEEKEELLRTYEAKLQKAESKQIEISEAWKKELEQTKRPWWKLW
ncbi:MAG TPA: hypothetical protein PKJ95_02590 [Atribacterota bacterium]|nr:hypothetical protein [Atribacterota bacterium]